MDGFYESVRDFTQRSIEVFDTDGCFPHYHASMEILCVTAGHVTVTLNGETRSVGAGSICVAGCYDVHAYSVEEGGAGTVLIFSFDYLQKFLAHTGNRVMTCRFLQDETLFAALKDLIDVFPAGQSNELFKEGFVNAVLGLLYDSLRFAPASGEDGKVETVRAVLAYIHAHYDEELSLQRLARQFGYSPYHFSRLFRSFAGVGLKQYINSVRLEQAAYKLKNGAGVTEAALGSGFGSTRSFYRDFTEQYGVTPLRYAKKE